MNRRVNQVPGDGNFTAAKAAFESALALRSSSPEVLRNLAIIAHAEKDHALAFDYYYAALQSLVAAGKINAIAGGGEDVRHRWVIGAHLSARCVGVRV